MESVAEQCWTTIEGLRHRVKSLCRTADEGELASVDAEMVALREFVFAALKAQEEGHKAAIELPPLSSH